jgi:hypothetical protein
LFFSSFDKAIEFNQLAIDWELVIGNRTLAIIATCSTTISQVIGSSSK